MRSRMWAVGLGAILAAAFAQAALAQDDATPRSVPSPPDVVSGALEDATLPDALTWFRRQTGRDIRLASDLEDVVRGEDAPRITATFEDVEWETALRTAAESAGWRVVRAGDVTYVTGDPATTTATVRDLNPQEQSRPVHVVRANEVRKAFGELTATIATPLLAVLGAGALLACQLLVLALFPAACARARDVAVRRTWLPVVLGAADLLGAAIVIAIAARLGGVGVLFSALVLVVLFGGAVVGLSGRAQALGARLLDPERRAPPLACLSLGWAVMAGVGLVPLVGQVLLIWWTVQGLGIAALAGLGAMGGPGRGAPSAPPGAAPAARGL